MFDAQVAVLEAGRWHRGSWDWWKAAMPAALTFNLANKKYNWDYHTVPQKHMNNRRLHQPRGKMTGKVVILRLGCTAMYSYQLARWSEHRFAGTIKHGAVIAIWQVVRLVSTPWSMFVGML